MEKSNILNKTLSDAKRFFREIPWFFGRHAFLIILFFMLLSMAFGGYLFYVYIVEPENRELKVQSDLLIFKEGVYQNILKQWGNEGQRVLEPENRDYPNPFIGI